MSALTTVVLGGCMLAGVALRPAELDGNAPALLWYLSMVGMPALVLGGALAAMVRGYVLDGDTLYVERLFHRTRIPLSALRSVTVDPAATKGSLRVFGNGGAFSFSGWYRSKRLGRYRMLATDFRKAVVLEFDQGTPIVVSPERPEAFAVALRQLS